MTSARGFTLLETLLAIAIMAGVSASLVVWLRAESDALARGGLHDRRDAAERWLGVLRDDVFSAEEATMEDGGALVLRTCHALPGEAPGWAEVRWETDAADGGLSRLRDGERRHTPIRRGRLVAEHVEPDADDARPLLWIVSGSDDRTPIGVLPLEGVK